jgi:Ca2+-binding EF-hand superfamily protein
MLKKLGIVVQASEEDRKKEAEEEKKREAAEAAAKGVEPRHVVIRKLFENCDADGNGFLSEKEAHSFAVCTGFEGTAADWSEYYSTLTSGMGMTKGLNFDCFEQVVLSGNYSDKELASALSQVEELASSRPAKRGKVVPPPKKGSGQVVSPPAKAEALAPSATPMPTTAKNKGVVLAPPGKALAVGPVGREDLVTAVFKAFDNDGDNCLKTKEMQAFVSHNGFEFNDEDWAKEFATLCKDGGCDPDKGVTLVLFSKIINDKSEAGCFCSDDELRDLLKKVSNVPKAPMAPMIPKAKATLPDPRKRLISSVFSACDTDSDNKLNQKEFKRFAAFTGFDGPEEQWAMEYNSLCNEVKADPGEGVGVEAFTQLVNDKSDAGVYCSDVELNRILRKIQAAKAAQTRPDLINRCFLVLDANRDGFLNREEMRKFAELGGFKGTALEWQKEFRMLCTGVGADIAAGLDNDGFRRVVEEGLGGTYSNEELRAISDKLDPHGKAGNSAVEAALAIPEPEPEAKAAAPAAPAKAAQAVPKASPARLKLIAQVFKVCDIDHDGVLNQKEMRSIVEKVGFRGSDDEWKQEYTNLCSQTQMDAAKGVTQETVTKLLEDKSDDGLYLSDVQLQQLVSEDKGDL